MSTRTALAVTSADLSNIDAVCARLSEWEIELTGASARQSEEVRDSALMIREAAKIRKLGTRIIRAAERVEAAALRRLGQLDAVGSLHSWPRCNARWLATLDAAQFDTVLARIDQGDSLNAQRQEMRDEEYERLDRDELQRSGTPWPTASDFPATYDELRKAALIVANVAFAAGSPIEVQQAVSAVIEQYELEDSIMVRHGLAAIVREALLHATDDDLAFWGKIPRFITFESAAGWVRIPRQVATLGHLRFMAEYRRTQAEQMDAIAKDLEHIVQVLEKSGTTDNDQLAAKVTP
jgi:hypothetical protein